LQIADCRLGCPTSESRTAIRGDPMHDEQLRKREQRKRRTKEFAKTIVELCRTLPRTREGSLIGG